MAQRQILMTLSRIELRRGGEARGRERRGMGGKGKRDEAGQRRGRGEGSWNRAADWLRPAIGV